MYLISLEFKGHVNSQNATFSFYITVKYIKKVFQIRIFFPCERIWTPKMAFKIRKNRHFDSAIFYVTSRGESIPTGSEKFPL